VEEDGHRERMSGVWLANTFVPSTVREFVSFCDIFPILMENNLKIVEIVDSEEVLTFMKSVVLQQRSLVNQ
jgi:hypothetical protein